MVLAAFTYSSGLRAPASIAVVKDVLIYITALAAVIVIPVELGGFDKIFAAVVAAHLPLIVAPDGGGGRSLGKGASYHSSIFPSFTRNTLATWTKGE